MSKLTKNSIHTVTVEGYSSSGQGVARLEGMAVFVRGALRGERCRISLMKVGKTCAWARVLDVLDPSPARVKPDCPHYPKCGGCALRHMSYEEELAFKRQRVDDALRRIGGLDLSVDGILAAKDPRRYRNKAVFPVSQSHSTDVKIGFYRARSHDVIDVPSCLLQSDIADKAGRVGRKWMHRDSVPAYDETTRKGLIRHVFVRTNCRRESLICIVANDTLLPFEAELVKALVTACPKVVGIVLNTNRRKTNVILGPGLSGRHPVRADFPAVSPLLLPGKPGAGGGTVQSGGVVRRADRQGDRTGSVLRHRDHQSGHGKTGGPGDRRRDRAGGGGRRQGKCPLERILQCGVYLRGRWSSREGAFRPRNSA